MDSIISWIGLVALAIGFFCVCVKAWANTKPKNYFNEYQKPTYVQSFDLVDFGNKKNHKNF